MATTGPTTPLGPEPVLLNRKEVDALYDTLDAVRTALGELGVDYIVTGGSLLGCCRQHSVLFCDDDVDIAILEESPAGGTATYDRVREGLAALLGKGYQYTVRPWEGGDRVRPQQCTSVFLDLFTLRRYASRAELTAVLGVKANGQPQSYDYVQGILDKIEASADLSRGPLFPLYHFATRKAVEMWPKEVYRPNELFPVSEDLKCGPLTGIKGPRCPVTLLKRAFGEDCFEVYYQSASHNTGQPKNPATPASKDGALKPLLLAGGQWEGGRKVPLLDEHYLPCQPTARKLRRPTAWGRTALLAYLEAQGLKEARWLGRRTVYVDGVWDLFHCGHLEALEQAAALGSELVVGVTGDTDASAYKRPPVVSQEDRAALVRAVKGVSRVICPCPLVVDAAFMAREGIDLVVHGFADDADAAKQQHFFAHPMSSGRFERIRYSTKASTTDLLKKIAKLEAETAEL